MGMRMNQYGEEEQESTGPRRYNLSALVVASDASNKVIAVRFKSGDLVVTQLPSRTPFQIWVSFQVTQAYIRARTPYPPTIQGNWGVAIVAINRNLNLACSGWWETGALNQSILDTNFRLGDNPYPEYGYSNNLIMPASDVVFAVHLVGSLASNLILPTDTELVSMPVQ